MILKNWQLYFFIAAVLVAGFFGDSYGVNRAENACQKEKDKIKNEQQRNKEEARKRILKIQDISTNSAYDSLPDFCDDCK